VVAQGDDWFTADVMSESIAASTVGRLAAGDRVNIERAASLGDRLGGHIVQGHVDGTTTILSTEEGAAWRVVRLALPAELSALVTRKGSIAIDGISLTVSAVSDPAEQAAVVRGLADSRDPRGDHPRQQGGRRRREPRDRHPGPSRRATARRRAGSRAATSRTNTSRAATSRTRHHRRSTIMSLADIPVAPRSTEGGQADHRRRR
jgi:Riboflavin synthase alpha chain